MVEKGLLIVRIVAGALAMLVFAVSSPVLATGPFDGNCTGTIERVPSCSPFDVKFTIAESRVMEGTLTSEGTWKGTIFSDSTVSSDGTLELIIGKQTRLPGTIRVLPDGRFSGTVQFRCKSPLQVEGTCVRTQ